MTAQRLDAVRGLRVRRSARAHASSLPVPRRSPRPARRSAPPPRVHPRYHHPRAPHRSTHRPGSPGLGVPVSRSQSRSPATAIAAHMPPPLALAQRSASCPYHQTTRRQTDRRSRGQGKEGARDNREGNREEGDDDEQEKKSNHSAPSAARLCAYARSTADQHDQDASGRDPRAHPWSRRDIRAHRRRRPTYSYSERTRRRRKNARRRHAAKKQQRACRERDETPHRGPWDLRNCPKEGEGGQGNAGEKERREKKEEEKHGEGKGREGSRMRRRKRKEKKGSAESRKKEEGMTSGKKERALTRLLRLRLSYHAQLKNPLTSRLPSTLTTLDSPHLRHIPSSCALANRASSAHLSSSRAPALMLSRGQRRAGAREQRRHPPRLVFVSAAPGLLAYESSADHWRVVLLVVRSCG
ncbi:hypothetical protein DFH09DRAFT_1083651 [Mycena vulgaris]|nr:hypothetical protein DFH09DRAFT_1083651 [Mycena vulgaris]